MRVTVNGQDRTIEAGTTMRGLLDELELEPIRVAVEINRELVTRSAFDRTTIREGDRIEIVTFVGGG